MLLIGLIELFPVDLVICSDSAPTPHSQNHQNGTKQPCGVASDGDEGNIDEELAITVRNEAAGW